MKAIESIKSGQITSIYSFSHGGTTQTQDLTITFTGANEAPELNAILDENGNILDVSVDEYASKTITLRNDLFSDRDDRDLTITHQLLDDNNRVVTRDWLSFQLIEALGEQTKYGFIVQSPSPTDAEGTNYTLRITATDSSGATANANIALEITPQERNAGNNHDAIYVLSSHINNQVIPTAANLAAGQTVYALLLHEDPDGDVTNDTYQWLLDGFAIDDNANSFFYTITEDDIGRKPVGASHLHGNWRNEAGRYL